MTDATTGPAGRTEEFLNSLSKMPLCRQLVPQGAQVGWPIPRRKKEDGRVYLTAPFYASRKVEGGTDLFPVFATLTVDWATQIVVEYADLRYTAGLPPTPDPAPVGRFPHPAVAGMTRGEYLRARADLLALYDRMLDALAAGAGVDAGFAVEFSALFTRLLEPGLEPQYRALAGKFVDRFKPAAAGGGVMA